MLNEISETINALRTNVTELVFDSGFLFTLKLYKDIKTIEYVYLEYSVFMIVSYMYHH